MQPMRSISRIAVGESLDIPTGPLYHTQGRDIGEMTGYPVCDLSVQSKLTISTQFEPLPVGYFWSSVSAPLAPSIW